MLYGNVPPQTAVVGSLLMPSNIFNVCKERVFRQVCGRWAFTSDILFTLLND